MTRAEAISQHIAKRVLANKTRKGFSTLYREALEDTQMSQQPIQHPKQTAVGRKVLGTNASRLRHCNAAD